MLRLIGGAAVSQSFRSSGAEPYLVSFVDIAHAAGLNHDIIYGSVENADYIVEANGCGVAFYDYDNDGWLDIFLLNGSSRSTGCTKTIAMGLSPT